MNKKIILCALLIIGILFIFPKGEVLASDEIENFDTLPIIIEEGVSDSKALFSDEVTSVQTNANYNLAGDYFYNIIKGGENFVSNVYVRGSEALSRGVSIIENKDYFYLNDNSLIHYLDYGYIECDSASCYVYVNYELSGTYYALLMYANGGTIENEKTYFSAKIVGAESVDDRLYVVLNKYVSSKTSVMIECLSKNTENGFDSLVSNNFIGNGKDASKDFFIKDEYLYLVGESESTNGLGTRDAANKVIVIDKININNLQIENYLYIGNNYDNELTYVQIINDTIYLDVYLNGSKGDYYHNLNKSYSGRFLFSVGINLKATVKSYIPQIYDNYNVLFNTTFFLLYLDEFAYHKISYLYSIYDLNPSFHLFEISLESKVDAESSLIEKDVLYVYGTGEGELQKIYRYDLQEFVMLSDEDILGYSDLLYLNKSKNSEYFYLGSMIENSLIVYKYANVRFEKEEIEVVGRKLNLKYDEIRVYVNETKEDVYYINSILDKDLSKMSFGKYEDSIYCYSKYFRYGYVSGFEAMLAINIEDGLVYDVGTILRFNGKGILNDLEINSGYVVNDVGKYHLIINGNNGATCEFSFEICDLSVKNNEKRIEYNSYISDDLVENVLVSSEKDINTGLNSDYDNISYELEYTKYDVKALAISLSIMLTVSLITYICITKYLKRKREGI